MPGLIRRSGRGRRCRLAPGRKAAARSTPSTWQAECTEGRLAIRQGDEDCGADMTRAAHCVLFLSLTLLGPTAVSAQGVAAGAPAEQDKQEESRPTGLPSPIKWTFNFDAGWGSFGFANSLFNNPKEPGVEENLSDQWFEGYVKPALSAAYTFASTSEIYGKLSVVGERTYGSVPDAFGEDVSSFGPEDLSIGWRSGKVADDGRERLGLRRRADAVPTRSRLSRLGRGRRRREPRRLLDQRAQGLRVRRDRPREARGAHDRSLLSRQGRTRRERDRQPSVGHQLRIRHR